MPCASARNSDACASLAILTGPDSFAPPSPFTGQTAVKSVMKSCLSSLTLVSISVIAAFPAPAQQSAAPPATVVKSTVDEVVLDFIARDKKGKPVTDIKADDLTVTDNGGKQQVTGFRLVQGAEAITQGGTATKLD